MEVASVCCALEALSVDAAALAAAQSAAPAAAELPPHDLMVRMPDGRRAQTAEGGPPSSRSSSAPATTASGAWIGSSGPSSGGRSCCCAQAHPPSTPTTRPSSLASATDDFAIAFRLTDARGELYEWWLNGSSRFPARRPASRSLISTASRSTSARPDGRAVVQADRRHSRRLTASV